MMTITHQYEHESVHNHFWWRRQWDKRILTRTEVIMFECPWSTATGTAVCRHQIRISLSQLPTASNVLFALIAMSVISAAWPRIVHSSRPVCALHTFTRWSSAPYHSKYNIKLHPTEAKTLHTPLILPLQVKGLGPGFPLYFGIEIQGLFKDFQGTWSCIFKDQFST